MNHVTHTTTICELPAHGQFLFKNAPTLISISSQLHKLNSSSKCSSTTSSRLPMESPLVRTHQQDGSLSLMTRRVISTLLPTTLTQARATTRLSTSLPTSTAIDWDSLTGDSHSLSLQGPFRAVSACPSFICPCCLRNQYTHFASHEGAHMSEKMKVIPRSSGEGHQGKCKPRENVYLEGTVTSHLPMSEARVNVAARASGLTCLAFLSDTFARTYHRQ